MHRLARVAQDAHVDCHGKRDYDTGRSEWIKPTGGQPVLGACSGFEAAPLRQIESVYAIQRE